MNQIPLSILWKRPILGPCNLTLSSKNNKLRVAFLDQKSILHILDENGNTKENHSFEGKQGNFIEEKNGEFLFNADNKIYFLTENYKKIIEGEKAYFSEDGIYTYEKGNINFFDNNFSRIWSYKTGRLEGTIKSQNPLFWTGENKIYSLDNKGVEKWEFQTKEHIVYGEKINSGCLISTINSIIIISDKGNKIKERVFKEPIKGASTLGKNIGVSFLRGKNFEFFGERDFHIKGFGANSSPNLVSIKDKNYAFFSSIDGYIYGADISQDAKWKRIYLGSNLSKPIIAIKENKAKIFVANNKELFCLSFS